MLGKIDDEEEKEVNVLENLHLAIEEVTNLVIRQRERKTAKL